MDINSLLKKLDISKTVIFWKSLFCGKQSVAEYLLDKANTAASALPGQTKENIAAIYAKLKKIYCALECLDWVVPRSWIPYYTGVMRVYAKLIEVLADGQVSMAEIEETVKARQIAYAIWKADDVPAYKEEA